MNKFIGVVVAVFLAFPLAGQAEPLEGVEYTRVVPRPVSTGAKIEVREFFWYGCPHCYALEPYVERWLRAMPKNAQFVREPAVFSEPWAVHARTYYAFEVLGLTGKLHRALFDAIQVDKRKLYDAESIADFVAEHGVDRAAFLNAYNSFGVAGSVNRARMDGRAYGIDGVPTLIVDGKYMTSANIAGGHDKVFEVVDFLIKKAAAERDARKRH
jgi:thiol:disulfide interchange protein DsbA